jgi:hypothetical protein
VHPDSSPDALESSTEDPDDFVYEPFDTETDSASLFSSSASVPTATTEQRLEDLISHVHPILFLLILSILTLLSLSLLSVSLFLFFFFVS